jgi:dihydropyrimidine dehydrogenase (NAD+) subunit PreT
METFYNGGAKIPTRNVLERPERIACIGGGPASLACAAELRQQGFQVTIFDKRPLPGGLNTYGVAEYKLRILDSLREIELIRSLGVEFRTDEIADETSLTKLEQEFDILFLGIGLGPMHRLGITGDTHPSVIDALEFIAAYKLGNRLEAGTRVAVIGAGNTAIDAAVAARRLGAENVQVLYRRGPQQISAFDFEFQHAKHEGVNFLWWTLPIAIHSDPDGTMTTLECAHVKVDPQGQFILTDDSRFTIDCDLIIPAIGQSPLLDFLSTLRGIAVEDGRIVVDRATGQTSNHRYFAGGDCVNGGREVVDAVADGKRAAVAIVNALTPTLEAAHG